MSRERAAGPGPRLRGRSPTLIYRGCPGLARSEAKARPGAKLAGVSVAVSGRCGSLEHWLRWPQPSDARAVMRRGWYEEDRIDVRISGRRLHEKRAAARVHSSSLGVFRKRPTTSY